MNQPNIITIEHEEIIKDILSKGTITAQFDQIIVTIPILHGFNRTHNLAFNLLPIANYDYRSKLPIIADRFNMYSNWERCRYINTKTGNPVDVDKNAYYIRLRYHSEQQLLTIGEITVLLDAVIAMYCDYIKNLPLSIPNPIRTPVTREYLRSQCFVSYLEVALDFSGDIDIFFLHQELPNHLYKRRTRKRAIVGGKGKDSLYRSGHMMSGYDETIYIGSKRGGTQAKLYIKSKLKGGNQPCFLRLEHVFRRKFLKGRGIESPEDILSFDFGQYWNDTYLFFDLDWEKILSKSKKLSVPQGLIEAIRGSFSSLEAYNLIKGMIHNPYRYQVQKWEDLNDAMIRALEELMITFRTDNRQAQGAYMTHDAVKSNTISKIIAARDELIRKGITPSVRTIKKLAGVAHMTAYRHRSLFLQS